MYCSNNPLGKNDDPMQMVSRLSLERHMCVFRWDNINSTCLETNLNTFEGDTMLFWSILLEHIALTVFYTNKFSMTLMIFCDINGFGVTLWY